MDHRPATVPLPPTFAILLLTLPIVYVGTIRMGIRLVPGDLLGPVVLAVALAERQNAAPTRSRPYVTVATAAAALLVTAAGVSALIGVVWISPQHAATLTSLPQLVTWQGSFGERALLEWLRIASNAAAFVATLLLVRTPHRFRQAVTFHAVAGTLTAMYALYSWTALVVGADWPLLANTYANRYTLRVGGTFPEPVALGGYLLTSIIATLWMVEHHSSRRLGALMVAVQVGGLLSAISAFGFLAVGVVGSVLLIQSPFRLGVRLAFPVAAGVIVLFLLVPPGYIVQQTTQKVVSDAASWQDRVSAWRAALQMWRTYPVFGVGPGQFAYNLAPFFPSATPVRFRGARVNSPALEVLSETGAIGGLAITVIFAAAVTAVSRIRSGPPRSAALRQIGWSACALLIVIAAGYYTSRYTFLWVFAALVITSEAAAYRAREVPTAS